MITVSDKATEKLKEVLLQKFLNADLGYRVACSTSESNHATFSIKLDKERRGDVVVVSHGIRIFMDPADASSLKGYELDYLDESTCGFCLKNEKVTSGSSQTRGGEYI